MGYKQNVRGIVIIYLNTKAIIISRHVIHHDNVLPYCNPNQPFLWTYYFDNDDELKPTILFNHDHNQVTNPTVQNNDHEIFHYHDEIKEKTKKVDKMGTNEVISLIEES